MYHGHVLDWIAVPAGAAWACCCCSGGHMNPNSDHGFCQKHKANCQDDRNCGIRVEPPVVLAHEKGGNVVGCAGFWPEDNLMDGGQETEDSTRPNQHGKCLLVVQVVEKSWLGRKKHNLRRKHSKFLPQRPDISLQGL